MQDWFNFPLILISVLYENSSECFFFLKEERCQIFIHPIMEYSALLIAYCQSELSLVNQWLAAS